MLFRSAALVGWALQRSIERHVRVNVEETNRRNGLLVEALDGAEAAKAMGAMSELSDRWGRLSTAAGEGELKVRSTTTVATNISQVLQQLSYVGIVAGGSFLVSEGALTLGALIACSILGGRALGPFSQLPQIMTQSRQAAVALRNFAQAYEDGYFPLIHCGTSYGHYKEVREELIHHPELREQTRRVMDALGKPMVFPEEIVHAAGLLVPGRARWRVVAPGRAVGDHETVAAPLVELAEQLLRGPCDLAEIGRAHV